MNKISNGAGVFILTVALILSGVAVTAEKQEIKAPTISVEESIQGFGAKGPVVWDNGMEDIYSLMSAQWDSSYPYDCHQADDFHFDEDTEVADVHWVGGYWNPKENGGFDWCIAFYLDDGSGEAPAGLPYQPTFAGPFCFTVNEYTEELIQETDTALYYKYTVDLPETLVFNACEKYWISIWGAGIFPPQSGWACHTEFKLTPAVWGSDFWGYIYWSPGFEIQGYDHDMCFQLTGPLGPVPPTPPTIDGPREGKAGEEICWTFHSDDENCDMVKYVIDWGDGTTNETALSEPCTAVEVCHTYDEQGDYTITAYAEDETGEKGGSSTFDVTIPRARSVYHPLIVRLFERFPNVFIVLRQLLG